MIKETNQGIVKVYFKDDSWWSSNGCDCCEDTYMEVLNFSHIEGGCSMIKVHFKGETYLDEDCGCCYDIAFEFSDIEGVKNPNEFRSCKYEMYNGSKHSEWDCLVSVFWDLVADKRQYDHFYDMCESFDNTDEDDIVNMLLDKGIEVVFLEDL